MDDSVDLNSLSKVDYLSDHENYRCGYCGQSDSNCSHGMWAYELTVEDYQALIDRGWRRSGKYVYKPNMKKTCCPQYTIKCEALKFKLRDSHKKVIRRLNNYLNNGTTPKKQFPDHNFSTAPEMKTLAGHESVNPLDMGSPISAGNESMTAAKSADLTKLTSALSGGQKVEASLSERPNVKAPPKPGLGADPARPISRKAKEVRREKWLAKQSQQKIPIKPKAGSAEKTLMERLADIQENPHHKLEMRLVRSSPRSQLFNKTFDETYALYKKYQITIHNDPPDKPSQKQFTRFLVDSPLQGKYWEEGSDRGYGSFHQQYLLDGKIIAVGVLDILPTCVSSVYLYYDPDYAFLTLGTYSALREAALVQQLHSSHPGIESYYLGFYIHSCPKMKYKGQYLPSYLLCPETYLWHSIDTCAPRLDTVKYSRFSPPGDDEDEETDLSGIICVYHRSAVRYGALQSILSEDERRKVKEYVSLVGHACASRMLLLLT